MTVPGASAQSREQVVQRYRRAWAHADETIDALPLDAPGRVPWWPGARGEVTLHRVLVHVIAETHRHAGHADIVRELVNGQAGLRDGNDNLPVRTGSGGRPIGTGSRTWRATPARSERGR